MKKRIICFTYAGGTAAFFDQIDSDFSEYELIKPDYSGHGFRHKEPLYNSFDELADDMIGQIKEYLDCEYALFGYSMGSISAVEVLSRILECGLKPPMHVFIAAHEPHTQSELWGYSGYDADEWVKQRTIEFGAVPEKLIDNKTFWRMYLPLYKADYAIIGKYSFEKLNLCTNIPVTVFYSETDTPRKNMEEWKRFFMGTFELQMFDGGHFFINQHHKEMAQIIKERME